MSSIRGQGTNILTSCECLKVQPQNHNQSSKQTKKAHKKWNFVSKHKNGIQYPGSLSLIQPFWEVTWGCIPSKQWEPPVKSYNQGKLQRKVPKWQSCIRPGEQLVQIWERDGGFQEEGLFCLGGGRLDVPNAIEIFEKKNGKYEKSKIVKEKQN